MRTLLLADDSITTQRVVALTFAEEAFRVVTVSDGQQALDAMAAARPDIVLAGTTLPRTNGYELSERMRGSETLRDIPVLLLSGAFETVDAAKLATCGARGVIEKPLEPTAVISRVRELLGLKDARPAMPAGRLVTATETVGHARKPARPAAPPPARPPQVSSWDELRKQTGLEPDARPVEGGANGSGREDYLDTLDAAFDSLDQHLAGRQQDSQASSRNPSPPLGQSAGAADPRSPGRRPAMTTDGQASHSVFEVDTDWFSDEHKERDLAVGRDLVADAHVALPPRPEAGPATPIFEVDDEWFAEDEKAREVRLAQQRELAAEMGIHEVELPAAEPAPADGLDFDFGLDDLAAAPVAPELVTPVANAVPAPAPAPAPVAEARPAMAPPAEPVAPAAPVAPAPARPVAPAPLAPVPPGSVADDFAALLAFEIGDGPAPAPAAPVVPEVTEDMLDQIAQRVVERLNAASFGAELRAAIAASVRETVRSVVSETSERLVRDEIARVRARAERDTQ